MRKTFSLVLAVLVVAVACAIALAYTDGAFLGEADGYLGKIRLELTIDKGSIKTIKALEYHDTEAIFVPAFQDLSARIIKANGVSGVDTVSGATYSSKGILLAATEALNKAGAGITVATEKPKEAVKSAIPAGEKAVYKGLGKSVTFRVGPGKDSEGVQVYSFNIVMASVLFDSAGRIVDCFVDMYEVSTPNYDGESMPHFSGWPGTPGYNYTDHAAEKVTGKSDNAEAKIAAEVNGWLSKRQRGDSYGMNAANEWYKQMDAYQEFFKGKTVDELNKFFAKYCSDRNGRPIKANTTNAQDLAKFNLLTDAEKALLADVVATATMSLNDAHGNILAALLDAYNNRKEITVGK
ncbi:MAG: Chlorophenol reductase precursor [Firmicutes bacterium ADurb.Bin153]|nr:MAG: Chlorophenol reductase precursor [Firmicutes bacterium ADurb.Bin153]